MVLDLQGYLALQLSVWAAVEVLEAEGEVLELVLAEVGNILFGSAQSPW